MQPLPRSAGVGEQLVLEVRPGGHGIDVLALDHEALVQVTRGALVREPDDARIHHRREHDPDLNVKPAPYQRR